MFNVPAGMCADCVYTKRYIESSPTLLIRTKVCGLHTLPHEHGEVSNLVERGASNVHNGAYMLWKVCV